MLLLETIRNDILEPKTSLATILRKAMVLAMHLKSDDLLNWVTQELEGFRSEDGVPNYRKFKAIVLCNFSNGYVTYQQQPVPSMPQYTEIEDLLRKGELIESVAELEAIVQSGGDAHGNIHKVVPPVVFQLISQHLSQYYYCQSAWQIFPISLVSGILDTVRTRLLRFLIEIERAFPDASVIPAIGGSQRELTKTLFDKFIMNNYFAEVTKLEGISGSVVATGKSSIDSSTASPRG